MIRNRIVAFSLLDCTAVARSLGQIADREDDLADAFFERLEEIELPPDGEPPGMRVRREEGFAVRLLRDGRTWLSAHDRIDSAEWARALRLVARARPVASYPDPPLEAGPWEPLAGVRELAVFPAAVSRAIRARHAAFPFRLRVRRHRRWVRVVDSRVATEPQSESFFSCAADLPWGRFGAVLPALDEAASERVAAGLTSLFRARGAAPPESGETVVVLGPAAAAVLLHEAVAHALETDTLILCGRPESAPGVVLGGEEIHVLDDPASLPEGVRRTVDDEGVAAVRRWLVREGRVDQPLADRFAARRSAMLTPGAARRGSRHLPPVPRSTHLELLPGDQPAADLLADAAGGLYLPEAARGILDPLSGDFRLEIPCARRIREGRPAEFVGPCRLRGRVADLLRSIRGIGEEAELAGAGWCAKGGVKLPVWSTAPAIRLEGVEIGP